MARCLELASYGLGTTYPNPLVGSVIVHENRIIGEGWHRKAGEPHAEVNAVNSVSDKSLLGNSTIYVSLEPCSHYGKTPPCCDLLIQHKIPNVVIGTVDPNPAVAGSGIAKLENAGTDVIVGILESRCIALNKRFFTFHQKKRPYIILKWAQSQDGYIAPKNKKSRKPVFISNEYSRQLVHKWRSEEQSILIGTQTAIDDNPQLSVREWAGENPVRIVIDKSNRIPPESHLFDNNVKTIVISGARLFSDKENIIFEEANFNLDIIPQTMAILHKHSIQSVIVEGGRRTLQIFIDSGQWDEARVFIGQFNLADGIPSPILGKAPLEKRIIAGDELLIFKRT